MKNIEVYEEEPTPFSSPVQTAACYLEIEGKLLLLQIASHKEDAGTWSVPGGKLEQGETPKEGAIRELFEETGISVDSSHVQYVSTAYCRKPRFHFVYHMFKVHLDQIPSVCVSDEHALYKWATPQDLEIMPLIPGALQVLMQYRKALRE